MQRVMTETIKAGDGTVRWGSGQIVDYPPHTWDAIAASLGRELDDFTSDISAAVAPPRRPGRPRKELNNVSDAA